MGALGGPKSSPSHDPRYIHRFPSLQDPSRRSPSHDLSNLPTVSSLQKGDRSVKVSVEPGPAGPPDNNNDSGKGDRSVKVSVEPDPVGPTDTLAHALPISLYIGKYSKRRCSLLTGGSADSISRPNEIEK